MATIRLRIGGREYEIACDDGQEEHLRLLADDLDDRLRALTYQMGGQPGEAMGLLLAALTVTDELLENKKEVADLAREMKRISGLFDAEQRQAQETRLMEIESSMAATLDDITGRIEKIAHWVETR